MPDDFDISGIDEVIHGRIRLGIMAYVASAGAADFTTLKKKLGASDGNLSVHLRKLEDAGYVAVDKRIVDRKPLTTVSLTKEGRSAYRTYLAAIARLIDDGATD